MGVLTQTVIRNGYLFFEFIGFNLAFAAEIRIPPWLIGAHCYYIDSSKFSISTYIIVGDINNVEK